MRKSYQAMLSHLAVISVFCSTATATDFLTLNADLDGDGSQEQTASVLTMDISAATSGTLTFDYIFLTEESFHAEGYVRDLFSVNLIPQFGPFAPDEPIVLGLDPPTLEPHFLTGGVVDYGDDMYSGTFNLHDFSGGGDYPGVWLADDTTDPAPHDFQFTAGAVSGFLSLTVPSGDWKIQFLVANSSDNMVHSALALDNINVEVEGSSIFSEDFDGELDASLFTIGEFGLYTNSHGDNPISNLNFSGDIEEYEFLHVPGSEGDSNTNAFGLLVTPHMEAIPEPSTYALLGLGGLMTAAWLYRRRRVQG